MISAMPTVTKILFAAVAVGLTFPIWLAVIQDTTRRQRRYDRRRNRQVKPVSEQRYRRMWVVDRDESRQR